MRLNMLIAIPRPLFTKQTDVLQQDLAKFRSREICSYICWIAIKFYSQIGITAADISDKFQSGPRVMTPNIMNLRSFDKTSTCL